MDPRKIEEVGAAKHKSWQEEFVENAYEEELRVPHEGGCSHCDHGEAPCICPGRIIKLTKPEAAAIENVLAAEALGANLDMVNLPKHYARFKIEPIRYNVENDFNWFQGNINKYTARAYDKHESPLEDIRKVMRYAEMWFDFECGEPLWWLPRGHERRNKPA